jgi:hypothetical protein
VKLREVALPESIRTNGEGAFRECVALPLAMPAVSMTFPKIAQGSFRGCSRLSTNMLLPAVVAFGDRVFESCTTLARVSFPRSVQVIGARAFGDCGLLKRMVFAGARARSTRQRLRTAERVPRWAD